MKNTRIAIKNSDNIFYKTIITLLSIWAGVYLLQVILPIQGVGENNFLIFLIDLVFYGIIIQLLFFGLLLNKKEAKQSTNHISKYKAMSGRKLKFIVKFCTILSVIGMTMLLYDRVIYRGLDYSMGIRAARYAWINTTGSIFSKIGNILIAQGYVGASVTLWFALLSKRKSTRKFLIFNMVICIGTIFVHALLNGGRSNIYIVFSLLLSVLIINYKRSGVISNNKNQKRILVVFSFGLIFAVVYSVIVFRSSIMMGGVTTEYYVSTVMANLQGEITSSMSWLKGISIHLYDYVLILLLVVGYLIHGQWVSNIAVGLMRGERVGFITFSAIRHLLYNNGITSTLHDPYLFTGIYISMPGALYYDFGFFGVLIGAIIIGITLIYFLSRIEKKKLNSLFILGVTIYLLSTLLTTFVFPFFNFTYSLFVLPSFWITSMISNILYRKSSFLYVDETI